MSMDVLDPKADSKKRKREKGEHKHKEKKHDKTSSQKQHTAPESQIGVDVIPDSQPSPSKKHKNSNSAVQVSNNSEAASKPTTTYYDIPPKHVETRSPFVRETHSFYLALSPCSFQSPLAGLCAEHISPLLLTFSPQLRGIVLAYSDARLGDGPEEIAGQDAVSHSNAGVMAQTINEYGVGFLWLTASFLIFRPKKGTVMEGYVNLQNESMLGLICYNYFNAGIERSKMPEGWRWVEEGGANGDETGADGRRLATGELRDALGYFVDASGRKVQGRMAFRVEDFDATLETEAGAGSVSIIGTMLPHAEVRKPQSRKTKS